MAQTSSPYGFQPISSQSGIVRPLRMPNGSIANGFASSMFKFQPVKLVAGLLQPLTAVTDPIFGIFAGIEYTPLGGRPAVSPFWPAGTAYDNTGTYDFNVYLWPAWLPDLRLAVQANGSVNQVAMGGQFAVSTATIGAGSTSTGLSAASVNATVVPAGTQGQFALVEFAPFVSDPASAPGTTAGGDPFTDLIVSIAYPQTVSGFQTSIG